MSQEYASVLPVFDPCKVQWNCCFDLEARFVYIYRNHSYQNKRSVNTSDVLIQLSIITRLCHMICLFVLIFNDATFSRNCKLLTHDYREHEFAYLTMRQTVRSFARVARARAFFDFCTFHSM